MSKYRRKPLVFDAIQWSDHLDVRETLHQWTKTSGQLTRYDSSTGNMLITTHEGGIVCKPGDWFVRDDVGEVYPILNRRFAKLYDLEEDSK